MVMMKWMLLIFLRHWAVRVVEFTPPDPIWFSLVWEFGYHMHRRNADVRMRGHVGACVYF